MKVASSRAQRCAIMRSCANSSSIRTTWGVRAAQRRLFDTLSPLFVLTMALQQWPVQALHHSASNICQASIVCQHLPGQHRLPTSASNICPGHQHLPATSADICWSSALNLNSQHLNGPSIWAKHLKHLSQHLNGPSICSSIWASISSISASIWPASGQLTRVPRALSLYPFIGASLHLFRPTRAPGRVVTLLPLLVLSAASLARKWLANPRSWANRASIASIPLAFRRSCSIWHLASTLGQGAPREAIDCLGHGPSPPIAGQSLD